MKKTLRQLQTFMFSMIGITVVLVVLFETDVLPSGLMATEKQTEFLLTTLMELLTLASVYMALRLFKFDKVHQELVTRKADGLRRWGLIRLAILLLPMPLNTVLYYLFMNTTFGYMAIILAICLPFVYPSEARCEAETES
jgi:hypothetical protein